jgi:hypothetical protein
LGEDDDQDIIVGQPHLIAFYMDEGRIMYVEKSLEHFAIPMPNMKVGGYQRSTSVSPITKQPSIEGKVKKQAKGIKKVQTNLMAIPFIAFTKVYKEGEMAMSSTI